MTDERIFAYLLGELSEEESERFDEECFVGEGWEQISLAEEDLIDAYLHQHLTPEQRRNFERHYLTTGARRQRVAQSAVLLRHVDALRREEAPTPKSVKPAWIKSFIAFGGSRHWALRVGLAVGILLVVAGGLWSYGIRMMSPRGLATLNLTISGDSSRSEGTPPGRVKLPLAAGTLRIYLKLPDRSAAANYRVELMAEDETSPLSVTGRDAESISVDIPAAQLRRGQYVLKLFEIRPDGTEQRKGLYYFNVE